MTRVVFRAEAEADLAAIFAVVAEDSPDRAQRLANRLRSRARILESHPLAGRPRPDLGDGLRGLFERPYVMIYRLNADDAEIVAIFHAMRDLPVAVARRIAAKPET
jgi:toxin ParE1/3/4